MAKLVLKTSDLDRSVLDDRVEDHVTRLAREALVPVDRVRKVLTEAARVALEGDENLQRAKTTDTES